MSRVVKVCGAIFVLFASLVYAEAYDKKMKFVLDEWIKMDVETGPIKLHMFRIATQNTITSKIGRPGGEAYAAPLVVYLEYSNYSDSDWDAIITIEWYDKAGKVIDGMVKIKKELNSL